jgi:transcriptional regulatory protein RtcR
MDEQATLLRALEDKTFLPLGSDRSVRSDFQLIAGANRDLFAAVREGRFREDLLARINLWAFSLPLLRDRPEDIEPNLQFELDQHEQNTGNHVSFSKEAKQKFLQFALSADAMWSGNFRDLNAAVSRMTTLASGGRISAEIVEEEMERLKRSWVGQGSADDGRDQRLRELLGEDRFEGIDPFDRCQLAHVVETCCYSRSLSDAGRVLFRASRERKSTTNDADRLRKYLARFGLDWKAVPGGK